MQPKKLGAWLVGRCRPTRTACIKGLQPHSLTCAKFSGGTPYRSSTALSTFLLDTLSPTSAGVSPTRPKKVVSADSSSASASTPVCGVLGAGAGEAGMQRRRGIQADDSSSTGQSQSQRHAQQEGKAGQAAKQALLSPPHPPAPPLSHPSNHTHQQQQPDAAAQPGKAVRQHHSEAPATPQPTCHPHNVHVPLVVLTPPPTCHALIAPTLCTSHNSSSRRSRQQQTQQMLQQTKQTAADAADTADTGARDVSAVPLPVRFRPTSDTKHRSPCTAQHHTPSLLTS